MDNTDLGQIFTRRILADYMVSLFTLPQKSVVLDPCFGGGVFLDSIATTTDYRGYGYEIDNELFNEYAKNKQKDFLYNADFLLSNINIKYDGIIMNPPYIRHEKIDDLYNYGITKAKLANNLLFSKLPRTANLYMYFVVKAINILRNNGELIVIFPESWLNSKGGITFKGILSNHCSVERRIHISGRAFEKDALVDVIILKLKKDALLTDCEPQYVNIEGDSIKERDIKQFHQTSHNRVQFSTYANIRRGVTTGCNEIFINPNIKIDNELLIDIISSPKAVNGFSTNNAVTDKLLAVESDYGLSNELKQYFQNWEKSIMINHNPKTLANKIKKGEQWYLLNDIDCKGIIFGYMVRNDMRFILNETGLTARDNFYVITPNIDIYIMLALLNNYYVYTQLESNGRKYGGGMLKLQKYDVESLKLTNLSVVSESDKTKLAQLGRRLAESGDKTIVDDITALLSSYEPVNLQCIKAQFEYMKSKRLENGK